MKKILIIVIAVAFLTLLLPLAVVYLISLAQSPPLSSETEKSSSTVSVYIANEDRVAEMDINEYLMGVVAAEMPLEFEEEALKAQAVAARTYLYSRIEQFNGGNISQSHTSAAVCTDHTHCQAYTSWDAFAGKTGAESEKIERAVKETDGQILTYNGEIISALFHSTSSGATESAVDVWGSDVPYLQSVDSEGDKESPKYLSSVGLSEEEFKEIAEENIDGTDWSNGLFSNIVRSDAGGIITIDIGGVSIKGTQLRSMYGLRSTNADISYADGRVTMDVRGYGHGVGMSQYGADFMAKNGYDYEAILKKYYTGAEISTV